MKYYLLNRSVSENNSSKVFEYLDIPEDKDKESVVPQFKEALEENDIEIFEVRGHQLMTSKGLMLIVREDEVEKI